MKTRLTPPYTMALSSSLPKFDRGVSWLCWAYNEEQIIEAYLKRVHALLEPTVFDYEIVVIDDGSTDRTPDIVKVMADHIPQIRLFQNPTNLNVGYSSRRAIMAARKEFLLWQTIDWSYDISFFRILLEFLRSYDVVAGVRRAPVRRANQLHRVILGLARLFGVQHITRRSDTIPKALISVINYMIIRSLFGVPISDYQNVCIYPTKLIQGLAMEATSSFLNPELLIKAYWSGHSIVEVPISFIPREAGEGKGTRFKAIRASVTDIFRLWFKWVVLGKGPVRGAGKIRRLVPEEWPSDAVS